MHGSTPRKTNWTKILNHPVKKNLTLYKNRENKQISHTTHGEGSKQTKREGLESSDSMLLLP